MDKDVREQLKLRGITVGDDVPLDKFMDMPIPNKQKETLDRIMQQPQPQPQPQQQQQQQQQQQPQQQPQQQQQKPLIDEKKLEMFMRLKMEGNQYIKMVFHGVRLSVSDTLTLPQNVVQAYMEAYNIVYAYNTAMTLLGMLNPTHCALVILENIGYVET